MTEDIKEEFPDVLFMHTVRVASGCMGVVREHFTCKLQPDGTYAVSNAHDYDWYEPIWVCHPSGNLYVEVRATNNLLERGNLAIELQTNGEHCAKVGFCHTLCVLCLPSRSRQI